MRIVQACAYANWPDESFEVWKWFEINRPSNEIVKEMKSLFMVLFTKVTEKKAKDLKTASRTIGRTDTEMNVTKSDFARISQESRFTHYVGMCLDQKRLQYFAPLKVIKAGRAIFNNGALEIHKEKVKPRKITKEENLKLALRQALQDDPKRIKIDRLRASLGKEFDYLFDWKESFDIGKSVQKVD